MSRSSLRQKLGFTLVEVMVAMAVVAVALPALLFALLQQLDGTEYMRDRTVASWVASNKLSEIRLAVGKDRRLPTGELTGESELAEQTWQWRVEREATEIPGFVRLTITVGKDLDAQSTPLHTMSAFVVVDN